MQGMTLPSGTQYVPMIWSASQATPANIAAAKLSGSDTLLGFNEPNEKVQAANTVQVSTHSPARPTQGAILAYIKRAGDAPEAWQAAPLVKVCSEDLVTMQRPALLEAPSHRIHSGSTCTSLSAAPHCAAAHYHSPALAHRARVSPLLGLR